MQPFDYTVLIADRQHRYLQEAERHRLRAAQAARAPRNRPMHRFAARVLTIVHTSTAWPRPRLTTPPPIGDGPDVQVQEPARP